MEASWLGTMRVSILNISRSFFCYHQLVFGVQLKKNTVQATIQLQQPEQDSSKKRKKIKQKVSSLSLEEEDHQHS
jgi:hypothetical protein